MIRRSKRLPEQRGGSLRNGLDTAEVLGRIRSFDAREAFAHRLRHGLGQTFAGDLRQPFRKFVSLLVLDVEHCHVPTIPSGLSTSVAVAQLRDSAHLCWKGNTHEPGLAMEA